MISAKIVLDSVSEAGARITTMQLKMPRFILAQFNTHRIFSRNASSSRAKPTKTLVSEISQSPVFPSHYGRNQKGMQAEEEVDNEKALIAEFLIKEHMQRALSLAESLAGLGIHKQVVNRYIEPWMTSDVVVTATHFNHFFALRCHHAAQPEIQKLAQEMERAYMASKPQRLALGEWHLPYVRSEDGISDDLETKQAVSVARCARVSYSRHDGSRASVAEDIALYQRLYESKHLSPFEHQAYALNNAHKLVGNFKGWGQFRKQLSGEFINGR